MKPFAAALLLAAQLPAACSSTLFLTIDTGNMEPAEQIAAILRKHQVKATFFLADEKTKRGDTTLDLAWAPFWRSLVADGHKFGSHTWRHFYFRRDLPNGRVAYVPFKGGEPDSLDQTGVCEELRRVDRRFHEMTGRHLDPLWRAPGGKTTPGVLRMAQACGFRHVGWTPHGFLGDELSSQAFPNRRLLERSLRSIGKNEILVMHLGIWSRRDAYWPMLDPLLTGLKKKGYCFAPLPSDR